MQLHDIVCACRLGQTLSVFVNYFEKCALDGTDRLLGEGWGLGRAALPMHSWVFGVKHAVLIGSHEVVYSPSGVLWSRCCVDGVVVVDIIDVHLIGSYTDCSLCVRRALSFLEVRLTDGSILLVPLLDLEHVPSFHPAIVVELAPICEAGEFWARNVGEWM